MVVVFLDVFFTGDGKFDGKSVDFSDKVFLHVCMYVMYVSMESGRLRETGRKMMKFIKYANNDIKEGVNRYFNESPVSPRQKIGRLALATVETGDLPVFCENVKTGFSYR